MWRLRTTRRDVCDAVSTAKNKNKTYLTETIYVSLSPPGDMAMRTARFTLHAVYWHRQVRKKMRWIFLVFPESQQLRAGISPRMTRTVCRSAGLTVTGTRESGLSHRGDGNWLELEPMLVTVAFSSPSCSSCNEKVLYLHFSPITNCLRDRQRGWLTETPMH
jgi:hypothetical protein